MCGWTTASPAFCPSSRSSTMGTGHRRKPLHQVRMELSASSTQSALVPSASFNTVCFDPIHQFQYSLLWSHLPVSAQSALVPSASFKTVCFDPICRFNTVCFDPIRQFQYSLLWSHPPPVSTVCFGPRVIGFWLGAISSFGAYMHC